MRYAIALIVLGMAAGAWGQVWRVPPRSGPSPELEKRRQAKEDELREARELQGKLSEKIKEIELQSKLEAKVLMLVAAPPVGPKQHLQWAPVEGSPRYIRDWIDSMPAFRDKQIKDVDDLLAKQKKAIATFNRHSPHDAPSARLLLDVLTTAANKLKADETYFHVATAGEDSPVFTLMDFPLRMRQKIDNKNAIAYAGERDYWVRGTDVSNCADDELIPAIMFARNAGTQTRSSETFRVIEVVDPIKYLGARVVSDIP